MDLFRLDGMVAVVTGATRGIGQAAAIALAEVGAKVAVLGNSQSPDATRQAVLEVGCEALSFPGDLADRAFRDAVVSDVLQAWGKVDILVNNAGTTVRAPAVDFAEEDWDPRVERESHVGIPHVPTRGAGDAFEEERKIINLASVQSFTGGLTIPAYAASKGGVAQITKALANEWARHNVNVNAIAPGYILTDMTRPSYEDPVRSKEIMDRIPVQRWVQPDDLKGTVVYLASRASDFVHGHILLVDGGWMAR